MIKTKKNYAEQVLRELENAPMNIDFKIDEREVFLRLDAVVNDLARQNFFDNWKIYGPEVDEQFITTWPEVTVVDQTNGRPSYLTIPSNYAALPNNKGIDECWPLKYGEYNQSVIIMSHRDLRLYQNSMAGNLQLRLGAYPQGRQLIFTECGVKGKYGNMGLRLVGISSGDIAASDPYPIPADKEQLVITTVVEWFRSRRAQPTDIVRDGNDKSNGV
jgi:hypothetical protein